MTGARLHTGGIALEVGRGPALLEGVTDGPSLAAHHGRYGALPDLPAGDLVRLAESVDVRGRGGAGFPLARKLATVADGRGRAHVVVNLSEGEPASHKDAALALSVPHLVLDGAAVAARALGAGSVDLVLPGESAEVTRSVRQALAERRGTGRRASGGRDGRLAWHLHTAAGHFVAGESSAVLELMAGRANLPVTTWQPAARSGHRGRPTLVSNAETFAHLARLALLGVTHVRRHGTDEEPGTTLLTLDGDAPPGRGTPVVLEVPFGTPWRQVLPLERLARPVLLGGYHGTWATGGALAGLTVSRTGLARHGLTLGAGIVLPLDQGCPIDRTSRLVDYLAAQSARRCGPCLNGLPALAAALHDVRRGRGGRDEVERLAALVEGRGACAHPDGTARLVRSMMAAFGGELALHAQGRCDAAERGRSEVPA